MREHKYRAWDKTNNEWYMNGDEFDLEYSGSYGDFFFDNDHPCNMRDVDLEWVQYTGLKDKNGVEIYEGDLVNVFFTSSNGENIHDCIYRVSIHPLYGFTLTLERLLWESYGYNQYPTATELSSRYGHIDYDYKNQNYDRLAIKDAWEENPFVGQKWKSYDYSSYIEKVGSIYENKDLLND